MSKPRKPKQTRRLKVGDNDPRMMRVNQRAHRFTDRRKAASRKACRGRVSFG